MIRYYKNKTVGFQLRAVMAICLLIAFSSIAALVYHNASRILLDATLKEQQSKVDAMAKTIAGQFDAYLETAQVLESTFQHGYLNGTSMQSSSVEFQGHEVNDIVQNGVSLINNNTVVDSFTATPAPWRRFLLLPMVTGCGLPHHSKITPVTG